MPMNIVFDRPIDRGLPVRIGPVQRVRLTHRRLLAGIEDFVRHFDGGWHLADRVFLEVRLECDLSGSTHLLQIESDGPWAELPPGVCARSARLYGDRLFMDGGRWLATDDDDYRCWIAEDTGLINEALVVSAIG